MCVELYRRVQRFFLKYLKQGCQDKMTLWNFSLKMGTR